jgi:hypothetical protein
MGSVDSPNFSPARKNFRGKKIHSRGGLWKPQINPLHLPCFFRPREIFRAHTRATYDHPDHRDHETTTTSLRAAYRLSFHGHSISFLKK